MITISELGNITQGLTMAAKALKASTFPKLFHWTKGSVSSWQ